jgi:hypothetical protein
MVGFLDSEELRIPEAHDLGSDSAAAARVQAIDNGFAVLWTSQDGVMRAMFDRFGKPTGAVAKLPWKSTPAVATTNLGIVQCADRSWLVRETSKELALAYWDANGALKELTHLPTSPTETLLPMQCADDSLVIGRRTLDTKGGNVVLWVSTVDLAGKVHDRRVKDMRGTADDIRMPQFSQAGAKMTSWWIQGKGAEAKVWTRELSCE